MRVEDGLGTLVGLAHDARDLDVDATGRLLGVILVVSVIATQEHLMLSLAKDLRSQLLAHAQARNHLAGHLGGALEVVGRTGRDVVAHEFLGHAAAQEHGELIEHLVFGLEEVVLGRQRERVAQRLAARNDRDLVHRVGVLQDMPHQGVTALVVGDGRALDVGHHAALALRTGDHALHGLLDLVHRDLVLMAARGEQRGLVEEIRQVGAGKAHGELGQLLELDVLGKRLVLGVHAQDLLAAAHVGAVHGDLTVKTAGTQQRRVQDVRTVGGGQQNHGLGLVKAVHLDQQLVQGLLALVVTAAQAGAALATDGVDLVDKDDRGRLRLGLFEQVAHAGSAHAHEHLHKVGAGDGEERHARLTGNGLGEQRLTGARRAYQQNTARNLGTQLAVAVGVDQKVANLLELLHGLLDAGDVLELYLGARGLVGLGVGLAELHRLVVGAHHLPHEVEDDEDERDGGKHRNQQVGPEVGVVGVHDVGRARVVGHELGQRVGAHVGGLERDELALVARLRLLLPVLALHRAARHGKGGRLHAVILHGRDKLARGDLVGGGGAAAEHAAHVEEQVGEQRAGDQEVQPAHARGRLAASRAAGAAGAAQQGLALVALARIIRTVAPGKKGNGRGVDYSVCVQRHLTSRPPA